MAENFNLELRGKTFHKYFFSCTRCFPFHQQQHFTLLLWIQVSCYTATWCTIWQNQKKVHVLVTGGPRLLGSLQYQELFKAHYGVKNYQGSWIEKSITYRYFARKITLMEVNKWSIVTKIVIGVQIHILAQSAVHAAYSWMQRRL